MSAVPPQTTGKPIGTRGHSPLLTFPQLHLKTWVATEVGYCFHFGLCGFSWHPPRDANNCDAQQMLMSGSGHTSQLMTSAKQSTLGHQPKGTAVLQRQH